MNRYFKKTQVGERCLTWRSSGHERATRSWSAACSVGATAPRRWRTGTAVSPSEGGPTDRQTTERVTNGVQTFFSDSRSNNATMQTGSLGQTKKGDERPTGVLLGPETETGVLQPWQLGFLGATDTWTGPHAWNGQGEDRTCESHSQDIKRVQNQNPHMTQVICSNMPLQPVEVTNYQVCTPFNVWKSENTFHFILLLICFFNFNPEHDHYNVVKCRWIKCWNDSDTDEGGKCKHTPTHTRTALTNMVLEYRRTFSITPSC